jgi:protein-L-isoaspartate(D-aspartate) O-methyltransferase
MESQRAGMVSEQLRPNGISDQRVLEAILAVPREEFLPAAIRGLAYEDRALSIGRGQTISQPLVVAWMTQALKVTSADTVLEVGTGSGYQAALLGRLARRVVTVELEPALAERAAATLRRLGFDNVEVVLGDGSLGRVRDAPFDAILVACAAREVPSALAEQLTEGGRMVIPLESASAEHQDLKLLVKIDGVLKGRTLAPVRFVPLR